ncbi:MAG: RNA polymerase sigma factor [Candidatus Cyclobacteriaceae bacterium M3_2C_046]
MKNLQQVFLSHYQPLHTSLSRYCRVLAGNKEDAEDLLQDTILATYNQYQDIKDKNAIKPYMFRVAGNLSRMRFRQQKFRGEINPSELEQIEDLAHDAEAATDFKLIYQKLLLLPPKMAETLILFHISDLSQEEIRKIQGGSLSGVKLRLKRGREKLLKMLNAPHQVKMMLLFLSL